ncbi:hypothetical protein GQR58_025548 [Nymphon striatum]|nr:hypothetical protein GQR58_025548 [Nymphon striatum]
MIIKMHPFAVYRRKLDSNEMKCDCYCVTSDHLKHNQNVVHCFLRSILEKIRLDLPHIKLVKYFSDGAASQYKNYKALINLTYHEKDHKLKAEHNFFATSHGKSPCDGIGRTIKREAANASLRATVNNQILTPKDLYNWAITNIKGVKSIYINSEEIIAHVNLFQLETGYSMAKTVPGTRSHHCFIPQEDNLTIHMKRIWIDQHFTKYRFNKVVDVTNFEVYQPGKYVACVYDGSRHIGLVLDRFEENQDCNVKFMTRNDLNLRWIVDSNISQCWIPYVNVICVINRPEVRGQSARAIAWVSTFPQVITITLSYWALINLNVQFPVVHSQITSVKIVLSRDNMTCVKPVLTESWSLFLPSVPTTNYKQGTQNISQPLSAN